MLSNAASFVTRRCLRDTLLHQATHQTNRTVSCIITYRSFTYRGRMSYSKCTTLNYTKTDDDSVILEQLVTIPKRLQYFSKVHPERELFVICSSGRRESCTAARLLSLAGKFAGHLLEQGFKPGDVLANSLPNSLERLVTDLGVIMAGCASMNAPLLYADGHDFFGMVQRSDCRAIILCPEKWSSAWCLLGSSITDQAGKIFCPLSCDKAEGLTTAVLVRQRDATDRSLVTTLENSNVTFPDIDLIPAGSIAYIFNTSGSTGVPKLVAKTHRDILGRMAQTFPNGEGLSSDRGVIYFNDLLLGSIAGCPVTTYAYGDTRLFIDKTPTTAALAPSELAYIILREKCTVTLTPNSITDLAHHVKENGAENKLFGRVILSGTPIQKALYELALTLADSVVALYGATETFLISLHSYTKESQFEEYSCGKALDGVELRVMDEAGRDCAQGQIGDILIRVGDLFTGYLNVQQTQDLETSKTMTSDSWIDLGDYGYFGSDDNLYVLGRRKDVIQYGGIVFYPGRLESKLKEHPDVLEATVLPVPDPVMFQKICACIKVKEESLVNPEDLEKHCRSLYQENTLSKTPTPHFYLILKGKEFPFTDTAKPNKQELKQMAEKLYGNRN